GTASHPGGNERGRAVCNGRDCVVMVRAPDRCRFAHQTRAYPCGHAARLGRPAATECAGSKSGAGCRKWQEKHRMTKNRRRKQPKDGSKLATHKVRLPGFITEHEVGLGDVIKRATTYFGLKPCGGCNRRAAALNRWMVFTR